MNIFPSSESITRDQEYELLEFQTRPESLSDDSNKGEKLEAMIEDPGSHPFSWVEYWCFFTIGLSMMWTWSMALAAFPLFAAQLKGNVWAVSHLQAFNVLTFSIVFLLVNLFLMRSHSTASYPNRLKHSLVLYVSIPLLLALVTIDPPELGDGLYLAYLLLLTSFIAVGNSLSQNAAFALVASFGRPEYAPAILTAEALASILPCVIEIFFVVVIPPTYSASTTELYIVAIWYLLSASFVGGCSLVALSILFIRRPFQPVYTKQRQSSGIIKLWSPLGWIATSNCLCLCISAVSTVYSTRITSVVPSSSAPPILQPEAFIPLAILMWNIGDLIGAGAAPFFDFLMRKPILMFCLSLGRALFIPIFMICNVDNQKSRFGDLFYLGFVQFLCGASNGFLSSICMMAGPVLVDVKDRVEAGAYMGLSIAVGLAVGGVLCNVIT